MAIKSVKNGTRSTSMLVGNAAYIPPIPVDYLVVSGGGGGGYDLGGGGGAGGMLTGSSLNLLGECYTFRWRWRRWKW
jgi:hypothetical protein